MAKTFTKQFRIRTSNLKISLEDFIKKLKNQDDEFEIYKITYTFEMDKEDKPIAIIITLVSQHYLFPIWNLCTLFMEYVSIKNDISELEI